MKLFLLLMLLASCQKPGEESKPNPEPSAEPSAPKSPRGEILSPVNTGDLILYEVNDVYTSSSILSPTLIGGTPADPKSWPASFTTSHSGSRCTGTMIGPEVLQLAAHCVGNGRVASITTEGKTVKGTCTHSPKYAKDPTADYALCKMEQPISLPLYEKIMPENRLKLSDNLILAGMGCTQPGGGGGNNNVFRVGSAPIIDLPSHDNDIVTQGNSALCFGDSGGSAFFKDENEELWVVGVNSRGDIRRTSYLSAVFTKDGKSFYSDWMTKNSVKICGLSEGVEKCRSSKKEPQPKPLPPICKESYDKVHACLWASPRLAVKEYVACIKAVANIFDCVDKASAEN